MCADRHLLRTIWAVIMLGALLMDYRNQVGARTFSELRFRFGTMTECEINAVGETQFQWNISGSAVMNRCMKADDPKTPESVSGIAIINLLKRIAICAALTSVRSGLLSYVLEF